MLLCPYAPMDAETPLDVQRCPKCAAVGAKAVTLTSRFVYLRCEPCGDVWVIPERRMAARGGRRAGERRDRLGPKRIA